jgi:hypothetical protein
MIYYRDPKRGQHWAKHMGQSDVLLGTHFERLGMGGNNKKP